MSGNKVIKLNPCPTDFGKTSDELEASMFDSLIPVQSTHMFYENDDLGLYIGLWDTMDMIEKSGPYACDEFMWLLEGQCEIKDSSNSKNDSVKKGESFVIPKGYDCQWIQKGYLKKYFVISEKPDEIIPASPTYKGIIKPGSLTNNKFKDIKVDQFIAITTGQSEQQSVVCYSNIHETFKVINWQSTAFKSTLSTLTSNLFIYVCEGSLEVIDDDGHKQLFTVNDALFIAEGTNCSWSSDETVKVIITSVNY
jgi:uncharacterized cupin superfamily protein